MRQPKGSEHLWVRAVRSTVVGTKAMRNWQEIGAVRALWADGDWTRAKKHAKGQDRELF